MILAPGQDYAARAVRATLGGVTLVDCAHAGGTKTPGHLHERSYFGFVLSGAYRETYRSRVLDVRRGTAAFHPAADRHVTTVPQPGLRILRVEIPEATPRIGDEPRILRRDAGAFAARFLVELREPDDLSPLAVDALLTELLVAAAREPARAGAWLERVHERLLDAYAARITLAELAADAGVHPAHLARAFRRQYGASIGEFVRRLRIERACALLADGDTPQAEIALDAGFSSQSHFAVAFRRVTGVTPGRYRREKMLGARKTWPRRRA